MPSTQFVVRGVSVPGFLYGTAWKEENTERLTTLALESGFRGIDTANQRRHYHEAAVGQAVAAAISRRHVSRAQLFLQTKFTFRHGQDHRLPYDPQAPIAAQVEQSFASSLRHLQVEHIDSYLLHGPSQRTGLAADDWSVWKAMESIHDTGRARLLGISNVNLAQLEELCQAARIQPAFVQNRCYASRGWDRHVREFCRTHDILYQGFSLLTANRETLARSEITAIAKRYGKTPAQIIFRFALETGMMPLTGTTNAGHMLADLEALGFSLEQEEITLVERLGTT